MQKAPLAYHSSSEWELSARMSWRSPASSTASLPGGPPQRRCLRGDTWSHSSREAVCIRTRVCLALKPTVLTHVRPRGQIRMRNAEEGARSLTLLIYYIIVWMPQIQDKNLLAQASERCAFSRLTPTHMKHPETSPPPLPAMFAAHHLQTAEARLQVTCLNCWHDITLTYRLSISFSNS